MSVFDELTEYGVVILEPIGVIAESEIQRFRVGVKVSPDTYIYDVNLSIVDPFGEEYDIIIDDVFQSGWDGSIIGDHQTEPDRVIAYVNVINYDIVLPGYVYELSCSASYAAKS